MKFINILSEKSYKHIVNKTIDIFNKNKVEYMVIGRGSAVLQGFDELTKDIDLYPKNDIENNKKIIKSLKKLGFKLDKIREDEILRGKDFIQFDDPFELDLIFAPDGFENYKEAEKYKIKKDKFPLLDIRGIIKSKQAAGRKKDILSIERLKEFEKIINEDVNYHFEYLEIDEIRRLKKSINKKIRSLIL